MPSFKIDPEFRGLLRAQTKRERAALALKIEGEGCAPGAIIVANIRGEKFLIDGHSTYEICKEKRLAMATPRELKFPDRASVIEWIIEHQQARRNMTEEAMQKLRDERQIRVAEARVLGQSIRTIAETEGVDTKTVQRDLEKTSGVAGATPEPQNGQVVGKDGKSYPAVVSIYCDRCSRTGPVKDCPKCEAERIKQGRKKKPIKAKPKPGSVLFDWKQFHNSFGNLVKQADLLYRAYDQVDGRNVPKQDPEYEAMRRLLSEYLTTFNAAYKRITKLQPVKASPV